LNKAKEGRGDFATTVDVWFFDEFWVLFITDLKLNAIKCAFSFYDKKVFQWCLQ